MVIETLGVMVTGGSEVLGGRTLHFNIMKVKDTTHEVTYVNVTLTYSS